MPPRAVPETGELVPPDEALNSEVSARWSGVLHELAAQASPLHERLSGLWVAIDSEALCTERWNLWVAKSNADLLSRQLEVQGFSPETVRSLLGEVRLAPGRSLPSWTSVVREALDESLSLLENWLLLAEEDPAMQKCGNARWRAFFLPFLNVARRRLKHRDFPSAALVEFERVLLTRFCSLSESALDLEFSIWGAFRPAMGLDAFFPGERARKFMASAWRDAALFRDYPVVARLAGVLTELWVEMVEEFLSRFQSDRADIVRLIFGGADPGAVAGLECALSDPHEGGRSVVILAFSNGEKLVYKPRSVGMEEAWFQFAAWANEAGCPVSLRRLRVLERGTHGWMEFAPHAECRTPGEAERYFERGGALLAAMNLLAGSDLHLENLIASGEHPVPIDLEVLMAPDPENWLPLGGGSMREVSEGLARSVLSVGLLPQWMVERKGKVSNVGAFSVGDVSGAEVRESRHIPRLDGRDLSSGDYVPEILRGFEAMYRFLLARRGELRREDGPLARFQNRTLRHVHRATILYARMIIHSSRAEFQRSGVVRSIEFEVCARAALLAAESHQASLAAIGASEIRALEQRDVPYFTGNSSDRDLRRPDGVVPDFFRREGLAVSRSRVEVLSENDLTLQKRLIQGSYDMMARQAAPSVPASVAGPVSLAAESRRLVDLICDDAILVGQTATWIAPVLIPETDAYQLSLIHSGLYDGSCGVLLFLLAAEKHLGHARAGDIARRVFKGLEEQQAIRRSEMLKLRISTGLAGMGGQIYALTLASQITGDGCFVSLAGEVAAATLEAIAQDTGLDIVGGNAGAIPAFLALHSATGEARWLDAACACGDRLLEAREETPSGAKSWKGADIFLSGYSHGAAGFAASLLRLFAVSGAERFRAAAIEAVSYENTLFDPAQKNWRDLRNPNVENFAAAWCHGAPGIALGRLLGLAGWDDVTLRTDLAAALDTTLNAPLSLIDHCCCGNAGRSDILLTIGRKLGRTDCLDVARATLEKTAAKAQSLGGYVCYGVLPATVRGPGFFQGLSGIGYTMLRSENPGLPSILGMELA